MKNIHAIFVVLLLFFSCSVPKGVVTLESNNGNIEHEDSVEYQLIV